MKLRLLRYLELFFQTLAKWATQAEHRFAFCERCGRNRYSGVPCYGKEEVR
jgi:hypothetical protein